MYAPPHLKQIQQTFKTSAAPKSTFKSYSNTTDGTSLSSIKNMFAKQADPPKRFYNESKYTEMDNQIEYRFLVEELSICIVKTAHKQFEKW
jgi:hypothetical protein